MKHPRLDVRTVVSPLFEENAFIIAAPGSEECVVVDPGLDPEGILAEVEELGRRPAAILNTHGHADHIAGNGPLKAQWPGCPLVIGRGDASKLTDPVENLSAGYGIPVTSPPADQLVDDGDVLELAGVRWTVRDTPGHSRGHVAFLALDESPIVVLGGDVLFAGSIGRSDFPDSDPAALFASIRQVLFKLPDDSIVLSGHGPPTTIGREKRTNPFVGERRA
ncbi:MAG: MBL fold metallo-hydrolase [Pirellulales bacterium]|nr:MBL fold metallo-hydrolase [Pirellulales bacterium]